MSKNKRNSLTLEERCHILSGLSRNSSIRAIAKELRRSPSVMSREIKRNSVNTNYAPGKADALAKKRRSTPRRGFKKITGDIMKQVMDGLLQQWSPQQISGSLKAKGILISHEAIYQWIWADKKAGGNLYKNLRHCGKKYNKRSGKNAGRGLIPGRVDIDERPDIVEKKERIGDWEADTVIGANHNGALVTLVERHSKKLLVAKVPSKAKKEVTSAIIKMLRPFKRSVLTITFDNGKEFAGHSKIAKQLNAQMYFAKPYHSWERGLNEHTNGLIRQYLPKGTNLLKVSKKTVDFVQKRLNTRPRAVLSYKTPNEVFFEGQGVAYDG